MKVFEQNRKSARVPIFLFALMADQTNFMHSPKYAELGVNGFWQGYWLNYTFWVRQLKHCRYFKTWENERHDGSMQKRNCRHWAVQLDIQLWDFTVFSLGIPHEIHHFYPFVVTSRDVFQTIGWWRNWQLLPDWHQSQKPPYALCGKHMGLAESSPGGLGLKSTGRNFHPLWQTSFKAMAEFQFESWAVFESTWIFWPSRSVWDCLIGLKKMSSQGLTFHTI